MCWFSLGYPPTSLNPSRFTRVLDGLTLPKIKREEVIRWVLSTRQSNALIVELLSLSALRNKSSSNPKVILTSPSAVPHAAKQGRHSVTELVATGPSGRCSRQYAPSVAKKPKYHLSPAKVDQYTVVIAITRPDKASNAKSNQSS